MLYDKRNMANINTLAVNTRKKALELYEYAKNIKFDILIYEGIRTEAQQRQNVKNGKSKTMKSYHLVGQAFDYVPVDKAGKALWGVGAYVSVKGLQFIAKAKQLGFTWGGDWDNDGKWTDETFLDCPHLQYNYKGYGSDTFNSPPIATSKGYLSKGDKGEAVKEMQQQLAQLGYKIDTDGIFGNGTLTVVKSFQKDYNLTVDGYVGSRTLATLEQALADKKASIKIVGKIKVSEVNNFTYVYAQPKDGSKVIQKAEKNAVFNISGSLKDWYEVVINNKRYYIRAKYCKRV